MRLFAFRFLTSLAMLTCSALATAQTSWTTVVNNGDIMPGTSVLFNSYNQPSINNLGTVVFRARSKGDTSTQPVHGIYTRNMAKSSALVRIFDKTSPVPSPNNNNATFIEFPSFPRIDQSSNNLVTRGTSQPVLTYSTPDGETKAGTSGVYTFTGKKAYTAAAQLGNVSGYEYFQVPGATQGTKFDQFPGAPSITGNLVVFKGNYTEGTASLTGIYYRDFSSKGGKNPVIKIADHNTAIPGTPANDPVYFGATAPPSAALGKVVFTGWDNEETPTYGGIYIAPLSASATITPIASIGDPVSVVDPSVTFKNFGESLSFDGRYIAFWASWGDDTRTIRLNCPTDGNKDLIAYCNQEYPHGHSVTVPVYQGIFLYDTQTSTLTRLAQSPTDYRDFLYWVFSGKPPLTGSSESTDGEPARWRASSFVAVYNGQVVFKAQTANSDGIYSVEGADPVPINTLLETGTPGTLVDPKAPAGSVVISFGIERDGYRNGVLAITAGMLDAATSESWAGIYTRNLP